MTVRTPRWLTLALVAAGCTPVKPPAADTGPVAVTVSKAVEREVTDTVDFTGRAEAPESVEIRPRVTGYLTKMPFIEGANVKKGDLLFEIDERPYQDAFDEAKATVDKSKAALVRAQAELDIALDANKGAAGAVSKREITQRQGARDEAQAQVAVAAASFERAKLNLEWCKVLSPIDGRVSRYQFTVGNLVTQDSTVLTSVVSENPIYAYFDVDDRTILRTVRALAPGAAAESLKSRKAPVLIGLADEVGYPHAGILDFADNQLDASTGTITVRGVLENPPTPSGRGLIRPGMFVRVRLPIAKPRKAVLVTEKAFGTDQGMKYVYVVDEQDTVQYRRVELGATQDDGLRVVESGLKAGERVVVSGLQLVRPKAVVKPEEVPMPVPAKKG